MDNDLLPVEQKEEAGLPADGKTNSKKMQTEKAPSKRSAAKKWFTLGYYALFVGFIMYYDFAQGTDLPFSGPLLQPGGAGIVLFGIIVVGMLVLSLFNRLWVLAIFFFFAGVEMAIAEVTKGGGSPIMVLGLISLVIGIIELLWKRKFVFLLHLVFPAVAFLFSMWALAQLAS